MKATLFRSACSDKRPKLRLLTCLRKLPIPLRVPGPGQVKKRAIYRYPIGSAPRKIKRGIRPGQSSSSRIERHHDHAHSKKRSMRLQSIQSRLFAVVPPASLFQQRIGEQVITNKKRKFLPRAGQVMTRTSKFSRGLILMTL